MLKGSLDERDFQNEQESAFNKEIGDHEFSSSFRNEVE